jgi:hypothetical protein
MPIDSNDAFVAEGGYQYDFLAIPGSKPSPRYGYATQTWGDNPRFPVGGSFHGYYYGVVGSGGYSWYEGGKTGPEVNQYSGYAGVLGTGIHVNGVAGTSLNNVGVYGQVGEIPETSIPPGMTPGVFGLSSNNAAGVVGYTTGTIGWAWGALGAAGGGIGAWGASLDGYGVYGYSAERTGVFGQSGAGPDVGPLRPPLPNDAGVYGTSYQLPGVIGASSYNAGVLGFSGDNVGVYGVTTNPASYAGYFHGNVKVTGALTTHVKNAVVPFPDGTQRLLHCMESPEHWFEDFGVARLKSGRAAVKLDADFAKVIKREDYRVFVTPEGDCRGLYVRRKNAKSFEVRELSVGKSDVSFSYRIVGRRKDIKGHRRFAKIDMRAPLPAPRSTSRKTAAKLRALASRIRKEIRQRRAKGAAKGKRSRALPKGPRPSIRPQLQLPRTAKK